MPKLIARPRLHLPILIFILGSAAHAQTPPDAGAQLREQERLRQPLTDRLPTPDAADVVRPVLKDSRGVKVRIVSIRFSGVLQLAPEADLHRLVNEAIGQELDFAGLETLAQRVTDHLKKRGYLLARAYLPRQDITDGAIEIALLAGRLDSTRDSVKIVPGGKLALRIDPERLKAIATAQLPAGQTLHDEDLQRAVLLMNDLPGVSARTRLEAGEEADSTRIVFDVEQAPVLSLTASLDNYGNRYTGEGRITATLQADDPLGVGDRLTLGSTQTQLSQNAQASYSLPIGHDGLRLTLGATALRSQTGGEFARLRIRAQSDTASGSISYPLIRARNRNLALSLGTEQRSYLDEANGAVSNRRQSNIATLSFSGDAVDGLMGGGFTQYSLTATGGTLDLMLPTVRDADRTTAGSAGSYGKTGWSVARLQRIDGPWTLLFTASGQFASKNLDSSEKFAMGGPTAVRAYPGGEASGDEGILGSAELRYDLPGGSLGQWQLSGFIDHGQVTLHKHPWAGSVSNISRANTYGLGGAGLAVSLSKPGSHSIRLVFAAKAGGNAGRSTTGMDADGHDDEYRGWLQTLFWF